MKHQLFPSNGTSYDLDIELKDIPNIVKKDGVGILITRILDTGLKHNLIPYSAEIKTSDIQDIKKRHTYSEYWNELMKVVSNIQGYVGVHTCMSIGKEDYIYDNYLENKSLSEDDYYRMFAFAWEQITSQLYAYGSAPTVEEHTYETYREGVKKGIYSGNL